MITCLDAVAPSVCVCAMDECCVCPDTERALRAYAGGHPMPAMTAEQRTYCLDEIAGVEGYERKDYEAAG